jgi:hypothetical protein
MSESKGVGARALQWSAQPAAEAATGGGPEIGAAPIPRAPDAPGPVAIELRKFLPDLLCDEVLLYKGWDGHESLPRVSYELTCFKARALCLEILRAPGTLEEVQHRLLTHVPAVGVEPVGIPAREIFNRLYHSGEQLMKLTGPKMPTFVCDAITQMGLNESRQYLGLHIESGEIQPIVLLVQTTAGEFREWSVRVLSIDLDYVSRTRLYAQFTREFALLAVSSGVSEGELDHRFCRWSGTHVSYLGALRNGHEILLGEDARSSREPTTVELERVLCNVTHPRFEDIRVFQFPSTEPVTPALSLLRGRQLNGSGIRADSKSPGAAILKDGLEVARAPKRKLEDDS